MFKLLIFAALLVPGITAASTPTASGILAASKAASGGDAWDVIHSMRIKAKSGDTTSVTLVDMRTGNMVIHTDTNRSKSARGVVGKTSWHTGFGGSAAVAVQSPVRRKARVTDAYAAAFGWWYPKRLPAKITLLGKRTHDAKPYWVLNITPRNGLPFELWIDAKSQLVARKVERVGQFEKAVNYSDYRAVHGVKIAFHRQTVNVYGGQHVSTSAVQSRQCPDQHQRLCHAAGQMKRHRPRSSGVQACI